MKMEKLNRKIIIMKLMLQLLYKSIKLFYDSFLLKKLFNY